MWNGRVYVLKCLLWYGSGKHNAVQIYIWMLPGIVRQARTNLGVPYMHVRLVYMLCAVLPCLVSWVFVECCSRETPGIQVGAGNISYHSQITKQTSELICQTVTLYTGNAGYIVYVDMDICVGGMIIWNSIHICNYGGGRLLWHKVVSSWWMDAINHPLNINLCLNIVVCAVR